MTETATCQLTVPNLAHLEIQIRHNAKHFRRMVQPKSALDRSVSICGAGPSLAEHVPTLQGEIWACNSALPYLMAQGVAVTHGFTIDQNLDMLRDWPTTYPVQYLLASSVHPRLVKRLLKAHRQITGFHSYLGLPDPPGEMVLYRSLFPASVQVGYGLNSVPRAVCLALVMGYAQITVYGADCACAPDAPPMPILGTPAYRTWMHQLRMYADGRSVADAFGEDIAMAEWQDPTGHRWVTRADMIISARHLLDLVRDYPGRVTLVGDTMPLAFARQPAPFLEEALPRLTGPGHLENFEPAQRFA